MSAPESPNGILSRVSPLHLAIVMAVLCLLIIAATTFALYQDRGPLPQPQEPPADLKASNLANLRYKPTYYMSVVKEDLRKLGLGDMNETQLAAPNAYRQELDEEKRIFIKRGIETKSVRLKLDVKKMWISADEGQGLKTEHLVLKITNKLPTPIAYRIVTDLGPGCETKGALRHNAIALAPKESIERSECANRKKDSVSVKSIDVLELSPLGYHYVSRLDPLDIGLDARTADGHERGQLKPCPSVPRRILEHALSQGRTQWHDIIDFYSRHNCEEYNHSPDYKWSESGPKTLPYRPPEK